jgi:hypothetical protein
MGYYCFNLLTHLAAPATILLRPLSFNSHRLWMLLPIVLIVAVVYKATKVDHLRQLPIASLLLWVTILGGMFAVCLGLLLVLLLQ